MANLTLARNADGTVTVRVGRLVEHIDAAHKTDLELYEAVLWACITFGVPVDHSVVWSYITTHRKVGH